MRPSGAGSTSPRKQSGGNPPRWIRVALLWLFIAAVGVVIGVDRQFVRSSRIAPGVSVAGVGVGGLDPATAEKRLGEKVPAIGVARLKAEPSSKTLNIPASSLGLTYDLRASVDGAQQAGRRGNILKRMLERRRAGGGGVEVPLEVTFNYGALKWVLLNTATERFAKPAKDARIVPRGSVLEKVRGSDGVEIDIEKTLAAARRFEVSRPTQDVAVVVHLKVARPAVTLADIEPIDTVLGTYTTTYKVSERSRTHNLELAARALDGTLVKPGKTFSYNTVVGPRVKETGYRDALIFVNGRTEPGMGGGICQVSSTVYNAALLAGMDIKQRSHHSWAVAYAPAGLDATVAYNRVDLKFANPLKQAVYIRAQAGGGRMVATVYGASEDKKQIRVQRSVGAVTPYGTKTVVDNALGPGRRKVVEKGVPGYSVTVRRITSSGGKEIGEVISNDRYAPHSTIVHVGPKAAPKPPDNAPAGAPPPESDGNTSGENAKTVKTPDGQGL